MNNWFTKFISLFEKDLLLLLSISIGLVFFILILQPFYNEYFDINKNLFFAIGMGIIIYLTMFSVRIVYPCFLQNKDINDKQASKFSKINGLIIWALGFLFFTIYFYQFGYKNLSGILFIQVAFICIIPPVVLRLHDKIVELKLKNESHILKLELMKKIIDERKEDVEKKLIEFNTENFKLLIRDIILFRSADNYVEIHYREIDSVKKKLIRNTLKNIELQINPYTNFVRCHRTCIINLFHVEEIVRNCKNNFLKVNGYNEKIPISRQNLLKIKEAL